MGGVKRYRFVEVMGWYGSRAAAVLFVCCRPAPRGALLCPLWAVASRQAAGAPPRQHRAAREVDGTAIGLPLCRHVRGSRSGRTPRGLYRLLKEHEMCQVRIISKRRLLPNMPVAVSYTGSPSRSRGGNWGIRGELGDWNTALDPRLPKKSDGHLHLRQPRSIL